MNPIITIEARLIADPELRFTPSGKAVCSMTAVTEDRKKNESTGKWDGQDPTFFKVTAWDHLAENIAESLEKGDEVVVIGKLKQRKYQTRDGGEATSYQEITANAVGASLRFRTMPHGAGKAERASKQEAQAAEKDPWANDPTPY